MTTVTEARRELERLKRDMATMKREVSEYRTLLYDSMSLASVLGIRTPAEVQRQIRLLMQLEAAYEAVRVARLSAGDPMAWAAAGITALTVVASVADIAGSHG